MKTELEKITKTMKEKQMFCRQESQLHVFVSPSKSGIYAAKAEAYAEVIKILENTADSLEPSSKEVHYLCDRRACVACHEYCRRTTDISHAENFIAGPCPNMFMESLAPDFNVADDLNLSQGGKIVAVDFDGTLFEDMYPKIGKPIYCVIDYVKKIKAAGNEIILWTCRCGEFLEAAIAVCAAQELTFDAINDDVQRIKDKYGNEGRKIYSDVYIEKNSINLLAIKKTNNGGTHE